MLAPDDLRLRERIGDETVATTPDDDQPDFTPDPGWPPYNNVKGHRIFEPVLVSTDGQLAAGEVWTENGSYQPDAVILALPNIANVTVELYLSSMDGGPPHARLGPGGSCCLPGRGNAITLKSIGSAACFPVLLKLANWGTPIQYWLTPAIGTSTK